MKKIAVLVLGVIMLLGAAPAFAGDVFEINGDLKARFIINYNVMHNGHGILPEPDSARFLMTPINLEFAIRPTKSLGLFAQLRGLPYHLWGEDDIDQAWGWGDNRDSLINLRQLYGQFSTAGFGTLKVGLIDNVDSLGLASLGYTPVSSGEGYIYRNPFDGMHPLNRTISYGRDWDNGFGLYAFYSRRAVNDENSSIGADPTFKDANWDEVALEARYNWDNGGVSLALIYDRNYSEKYDIFAYKGIDRKTAWYVNPAVAQVFGNFSLHAEAMFGWGKEWIPDMAKPETFAADTSGYAFYADLNYDYGQGDAALLGWYASGTRKEDRYGDGPQHNLVGMGDFAPLLVAFYDTTLGYGPASSNAAPSSGNGNGPGNNWGIVLTGKHAAADWLTLDWAVGYTALIHPLYRWENPATGKVDYSGTSLGWEVDFGLTAQLRDNLSFSTMYGYMMAGNAFNHPDPSFNGVNLKDSFVWVSTLVFRF